MLMKLKMTLLLSLLLVACATEEEKAIDKYIEDLEEQTVDEYLDEQLSRHEGFWRNDTEKLDYNFVDDANLLIIREESSSECTYEVDTYDVQRMTFWFRCHQPDWPGYAEFHEFNYTDDFRSFVDTLYIQGIPNRVEGTFVKFGN
jgi:hypothetical protein